MMTIINVFAARVCSGGCCADGRVDGQTDRCVGKPCPPSILCSPGASLGWFALASSILSQLSGLGMGSEPLACGLRSLPQPWWSRDELGGEDRDPQERGLHLSGSRSTKCPCLEMSKGKRTGVREEISAYECYQE